MTLLGQPGTKAKVKIGGKSYKGKIGSDGMGKIKLKKAYSVDTEYKVTFTKNGMKRVVNFEVSDDACVYPLTVAKTSKKVTVKCLSMKKGDVVYFYVNNVYKKQTMKKNGTNTFTIALDQEAGDYTTWDALAKTSKGKILYSMTGELDFED